MKKRCSSSPMFVGLIVLLATLFSGALHAKIKINRKMVENFNTELIDKVHFFSTADNVLFSIDAREGTWKINGEMSEPEKISEKSALTLTEYDDRLYFTNAKALFAVSDGKTEQIHEFETTPKILSSNNSGIFILADSKLWNYTAGAGMVSISNIEGNIVSHAADSEHLYFIKDDKSVWSSNGIPEGTGIIAQGKNSAEIVSANDNAFLTIDGVLHTTDGTAEGTLAAGDFSGTCRLESKFGEIFVLNASNLYMYDNATSKFKLLGENEIAAAAPWGYLNGSVFYSENNKFFKQDGDTVTQLAEFAFFGEKTPLLKNWTDNYASAGNYLFFTAYDSTYGKELWVTDGTKDGTHVLNIRDKDGMGSEPSSITESNGNVYFTAYDGAPAYGIFRTNGENVEQLMSLKLRNKGLSAVTSMKSVGDKVFLLAEDEQDNSYSYIDHSHFGQAGLYKIQSDNGVTLEKMDDLFYEIIYTELFKYDDNIYFKSFMNKYSHNAAMYFGINGNDETLVPLYETRDFNFSQDYSVPEFFYDEFLLSTVKNDHGYGGYFNLNLKNMDANSLGSVGITHLGYSLIPKNNFILLKTSQTFAMYPKKYAIISALNKLNMLMFEPDESLSYDIIDEKFTLSSAKTIMFFYGWYDELIKGGKGLFIKNTTWNEDTQTELKWNFSLKFPQESDVPASSMSYPKFYPVADKVYFSMKNAENNTVLYVTDGTEEGTKNIENTQGFNSFFAANDTLFAMKKTDNGEILFRCVNIESDDFEKVLEAEKIELFAEIGNKTILKAAFADGRNELIFIDSDGNLSQQTSELAMKNVVTEKENVLFFKGVENGTSYLYALNVDTEELKQLCEADSITFDGELNGKMFFNVNAEDKHEIFTCDSLGDKVTRLISSEKPIMQFAKNDGFIFYKTAEQIWSTNGKEKGTGEIGECSTQLNCLREYSEFIVFTEKNDNGYDLFMSNGRSIRQLNELPIAPSAIQPNNAIAECADNAVYYMADNGIDGPEIHACVFEKDPVCAKASIKLDKTIAKEGGDEQVECTVELNRPLESDTVLKPNFSGTAELGSDFDAPASFVIPAGETAGSFIIKIKDDETAEPKEKIVITITPAENATITPAILKAAINIIDNDVCVISYIASEGGAIKGIAKQEIVYGGHGCCVIAIPKRGYSFVKWDDGLTTPFRKATNVTESRQYTALFEKLAAYSISGKIKGLDSYNGVCVKIENTKVPVSADGSYIIEGVANGVYTVKPLLTGYSFEPKERLVNIMNQNISGVNFTALKCEKGLVAIRDAYALTYGMPLNISAPGVLGNDSFDSNNNVSAVCLEPTTHGSLNFRKNGSFTYSPNDAFEGNDCFTYQLMDNAGNLSEPATVRITISALKVTLGSHFTLPSPRGLNSDDNMKCRLKLLAENSDMKKQMKLNCELAGSKVKAVWKKRVQLFDDSPFSLTDSVPHQAKIFSMKLKTPGKLENNKAILDQKIVVVPPTVEQYALSNGKLFISGTYFSRKPPKVFLQSMDNSEVYKCSVKRNSYRFNPVSGESELRAKVPSSKISTGKYKIIILNKLGIGVLKPDERGVEKLPVIDIIK